MDSSPTWRINVVFHKVLVDSHYTVDPTFDHSHYRFIFAAGKRPPPSYNENFGYNIIKCADLPSCTGYFQEHTYMMPATMRNVFLSKAYGDTDYTGFMEYDMLLAPGTTKQINDILKDSPDGVILSYRHPVKNLYTAIGATINFQPEIPTIVTWFNEHFKTNFDPEEIALSDEKICSQQSFIASTKLFETIMNFTVPIMESHILETEGSWIRPSMVMEDIYGIALLLLEKMGKKIVKLPLQHRNMKLWSDPK